MKIRAATFHDIDQALAAGPYFHGEAPPVYQAMPLDLDKLRESLIGMIRGGIFFVAEEDDGRIIGFAGAVIGSAFFSRAPMAMEVFWWIYPEYRGGLVGPRLFARLKKAAAGKWLILLTLEGDNADGLRAFYERQGAVLFERAYAIRL